MAVAKTLAQYCGMYCANEDNYIAAMNFLKGAGISKCNVPPNDEIYEYEWADITLCIGGGSLYFMNKQGTKIDDLTNPKCKLRVYYNIPEKKIRRKTK